MAALSGSLRHAVSAFCRALLKPPACAHGRVVHNGEYCPDCGESVQVTWVQLRCQRCETRRAPKPLSLLQVVPVERHCRYCGETAVRVVSKSHIDRHELPLSVLVKHTATQLPATLSPPARHALKTFVSSPMSVQRTSQVLDVIVK